MRNIKLICYISVLLCLCMPFVLRAEELSVIPYPSVLEQGEGNCSISADTKLVLDHQLKDQEVFYSEYLASVLGFPLRQEGKADSKIQLSLQPKANIPQEGYRMLVTESGVDITASDAGGLFYGLQTFTQLLRKDASKVTLPVVRIEDHPRFLWRGCMLDVSRTFMSKNLLMRYIDLMAVYKLNTLHLHLTDDQGWRLEIKRYPKLTSIGSKFDAGFNEMGGYYTQEEMKEIVRYAALRNVTIVPEFELPGHELAAIASYPELSCRNVQPKIHPFFMGPSVHEEIFCAGKPEVYEFIFHVLDEMMDIFPSKYIHIGGDEAPKKEWKTCSLCQQVIRENHLADEEELQSFFVTKIGNYLRSKGRILVGWDEITDGGKLTGDEVVMFWRGWKAKEMNEIARKGFRMIASPTTCCYFDYDYRTIDTKNVYHFEPIPEELEEAAGKNYMGVQANFWSHIDRSESRIDKQLFPRLFALAEIAWSQTKDWKRFKKAAVVHSERLRAKAVNCYYDKSIYNPEIE